MSNPLFDGETPGFNAHRRAMVKLARQINARSGLDDESVVTAEAAQEQMRALGIRPEDNLFSRDIVCARQSAEEA